jgi:hypothetical protein
MALSSKGNFLSSNQHMHKNLQQSRVVRFSLQICLSGLIVLLLFGVASHIEAPRAHAAAQDREAMKAIINEVFGPDGPAAISVATCESGLDPNAYNPVSVAGSHAEGLFQILVPSTWVTTSQANNSPYDARANTLAAHEIFVRDGYSWREWSCQP